MKCLLSLVAKSTVALVMGSAISTVSHAQSVKLTYAHSENLSSTTAAIAFEAIVEVKSGGEIQVNRVIHGALGSDRDVVDQLRLGELEFYVVGLSGSERNQALQTGLIDRVEGSLSGAVGNGHLDILDHVSFTGHSFSYMAYLANKVLGWVIR